MPPTHRSLLKLREKAAPDDRESASARGYGAEWRRYRLAYLAAHPSCVVCRRPAQCVDHIQRVSGPEDALFWDGANHQALCNVCHSRKTAMEDGGFGNSKG